ncbi:hypothetical protein [Haloferula sp.]|uniref:hypothetical protein n=1 Tax=Haloferula sp. TaxID=2497595 RepID=UPI003C75102C
MKRSRSAQPPERLKALADQAFDYARHMMRTSGSVPPTVIADTDEGYVFCMPSNLADEAAKDNFAEVAKKLTVAWNAQALVIVVEAWVKFARPDGKLDMDIPPSQSVDRKEVVALMLEDRSRSATSLAPIIRDDSEMFASLNAPPPLEFNETGGRFAGLMPRHQPSASDAASAKADLLAMGMDIVNRGFDPTMN